LKKFIGKTIEISNLKKDNTKDKKSQKEKLLQISQILKRLENKQAKCIM